MITNVELKDRASLFMRALRAPGTILEVYGTAKTQIVENDKTDTIMDSTKLIKEAAGYSVNVKPRRLDRYLDKVVRAGGSIPCFFIIQLLLITWAFLGIPFYLNPLWPIVISDAQALLCYVFDTFLMRQTLNQYYENLNIVAELHSRRESTSRMLLQLCSTLDENSLASARSIAMNDSSLETKLHIPEETRFAWAMSFLAFLVGHIYFVIFYWACIFVWLGFGTYAGWSNQWQLDMNSATSAAMVFVFSFLTFLRERHIDHSRASLDAVYKTDAVLEFKLRRLVGDDNPNPLIIIPSMKVNPIQRVINYYADVAGALVGIALLSGFVILWLAIGPVLQFNSNWWLLIGTYCGIVGLNDGFVLRNVQSKFDARLGQQFDELGAGDRDLLESLGLSIPAMALVNQKTLSYRASKTMNKICGHEFMVIAGVLLIIGLLTGSTIMQWSVTGQLLSNIPPSIVETFFMIILITGHNAADKQRRANIFNLFQRRVRLLSLVDAIEPQVGEQVVVVNEKI